MVENLSAKRATDCVRQGELQGVFSMLSHESRDDRRWAGFATTKLPIELKGRNPGEYYQFVERYGERSERAAGTMRLRDALSVLLFSERYGETFSKGFCDTLKH
jgi:hypothetical protein